MYNVQDRQVTISFSFNVSKLNGDVMRTRTHSKEFTLYERTPSRSVINFPRE